MRSSSFLPSEMTLWDYAIFLIFLGCTISGRALVLRSSLSPAPNIQKHCFLFHSGMMVLLTYYWCSDFFSSLNALKSLFQCSPKSCGLEIFFKMKTEIFPLLTVFNGFEVKHQYHETHQNIKTLWELIMLSHRLLKLPNTLYFRLKGLQARKSWHCRTMWTYWLGFVDSNVPSAPLPWVFFIRSGKLLQPCC